MDLFKTLTASKPVLVTRCSKCNLPLEILERQIIGLGADCEENAKKAFSVDVSRGKSLSGDTWFNFLAIFGSPETVDYINDDMLPTLTRLAQTAITLGDKSDLSVKEIDFQFILDCFSISRNCAPELGTIIQNALNELGYSNFIALASGDFCKGTAVLGYDDERKIITLKASIRRSASEVFNLLRPAAQRPDKTFWLIHVKHAQIVLDTILLRFLPDSITIEPSFYTALELSKNLPPEPVEPPRFNVEEIDTVLITIPMMENGNYIYTKSSGPKIYPFMMDASENGVKGSYCKERSNSGVYSYIIPRLSLDKVTEFFNSLEKNSEAIINRSKGKRK